MLVENIIIIGTMLGYSVATTFGSRAIRKSCNKKSAENIQEKLATLPENTTQEEIDKIIKKENLKCNVKYSFNTALLSVGLGAVATGVIYNVDNIVAATSNNNTTADNDTALIEVQLNDAEVTNF